MSLPTATWKTVGKAFADGENAFADGVWSSAKKSNLVVCPVKNGERSTVQHRASSISRRLTKKISQLY
jgi:hypothetical protein